MAWSQMDPEDKLWLASRMYIRGEINIKKLKKIERLYDVDHYDNILFIPTMFDLLINLVERVLQDVQFNVY